MAEDIYHGYTGEHRNPLSNVRTIGSKVTAIMQPRFPGRIKPSREGSSFYEMITALESRGGSTYTTAMEAETIVEELDEVRLTLGNSITCSEVSNS